MLLLNQGRWIPDSEEEEDLNEINDIGSGGGDLELVCGQRYSMMTASIWSTTASILSTVPPRRRNAWLWSSSAWPWRCSTTRTWRCCARSPRTSTARRHGAHGAALPRRLQGGRRRAGVAHHGKGSTWGGQHVYRDPRTTSIAVKVLDARTTIKVEWREYKVNRQETRKKDYAEK
uniref:Uncharacterized protein n=1 Tax=Arundo donax TaxID=35708 RepID=A0A0A9FC06_ARUDO